MTLPADLGIEHSTALKDALAARADDTDIALDAGQVTRVHTASLQVLLAWLRLRAGRGRTTGWQATGEALHAAAATLGLVAALDMPATPSLQPPSTETTP